MLIYFIWIVIYSWDETFKRELEVYRETKEIGEVW